MFDDGLVVPRFNYIGSNLKDEFRVPTLFLFMELVPSYAMDEPDEDNSFFLFLSGKGTSSIRGGSRIATKIWGYVSGTQGCGCSEYGHLSPTRKATVSGPGRFSDDVVPTYGTWSARWRRREVPR